MDANLKRIKKWKNIVFNRHRTPPYLVFFVTGKCNLKCRHCFNWKAAESYKDDIEIDEISRASGELGKIYDLLLSGGEPFLRKDLAEIIKVFYINNKVEKICLPTNGYLPEVIRETTEDILKICKNTVLEVSLSIDGPCRVHNDTRGREDSFEKVVCTYDTLKELKKHYRNLVLNTSTTITNKNISYLQELDAFISDNMPQINNIFYSFFRSTGRDKEVFLPDMADLEKNLIWNNRKSDFVYFLVDAMSFYLKALTLEKHKQILRCAAGDLIGVLESNGDVKLCELLPSVGNIKKQSFSQIWHSPLAQEQRKNIRDRRCFCSHECFLAPSILYKPKNYLKLILSMVPALKTVIKAKRTILTNI
ncbi:MAG: radical SAM protein [Candidatus Omnitrophica bacterium]|nr:radical SAM protein [Candidatus Omnitrophota bacterium]MDD5429417.1 radical SAM protein [Candidatus Omnitrophota bacterium]